MNGELLYLCSYIGGNDYNYEIDSIFTPYLGGSIQKPDIFEKYMSMHEDEIEEVEIIEHYRNDIKEDEHYGDTYDYKSKFYKCLREIMYFNYRGDSSGELEEEQYTLVAKWVTGDYIYVNAWHDYTGFGCQGGMKLYADKNIDNLARFCMSEKVREAFYNSWWYLTQVKNNVKENINEYLISDLTDLVVNYIC